VDLVPRTLGVKPALPIEQSQPHAIFRLCTRCLKTPRSSRVVDAWRTATGGCRITAELVTAGYQSMELDAFPLPVDFMIRGSRTLQAHICRRRMCYRMVCRLSRSVSFDPVRRRGRALTRFVWQALADSKHTIETTVFRPTPSLKADVTRLCSFHAKGYDIQPH